MKILIFYFAAIQIAFATSEQISVSTIDGRIINGQETTILDHPYQAGIEFSDSKSIRCGGSIIARTWILARASCVHGYEVSDLSVRIGTTYQGLGGTLHNISYFEIHPNYSSATYDYDIVLIQLSQPIHLSETAQIIGLADDGADVVEGTLGTVTGWGSIYESGSSITVLHVAELPVLSRSVCRDLYTDKEYTISERNICVGYWMGGVDICGGDGGAAFVVGSKIYGISSWAVGCAEPRRPRIYIAVGALRDWITEKTGI